MIVIVQSDLKTPQLADRLGSFEFTVLQGWTRYGKIGAAGGKTNEHSAL
jgi:hypothetical protein